MKFFLGIICGLILGTALSVFAQLVPFDAPLAEQLNGQRQENFLKLERELDHLRHDRLDPCRR